MELSYEQLKETIDKRGVQAGVELIVWALLSSNKVELTEKGKREISAWLSEYSEKHYGFTPKVLVLFGLHKQHWLMELIREAMLDKEFMKRLDSDVNEK